MGSPPLLEFFMANPAWKVTLETIKPVTFDYLLPGGSPGHLSYGHSSWYTGVIVLWKNAPSLEEAMTWADEQATALAITPVRTSVEEQRPIKDTPRKYFILTMRPTLTLGLVSHWSTLKVYLNNQPVTEAYAQVKAYAASVFPNTFFEYMLEEELEAA
jgi:hypothetical protein